MSTPVEQSLSIADQGETYIFVWLYGDKLNNVQFLVKDASLAAVDLSSGDDYGFRIKDFRGANETVLIEYRSSDNATDGSGVQITEPTTGTMQVLIPTANFPTIVGHNKDLIMEFFWDEGGDGEEYLGIRKLRIKG